MRDRQLSAEQLERYSRHFLLRQLGEKGQGKLLDAKVLLVGAGGLGSPAALYLAAAGIGTLGIVDADVVDRSNLQRQVLHTTDRIGMPKTESAAMTIHALNPDVQVRAYPERLTVDNVMALFRDYDVIVDGSDNFPTRYLVNDAAVLVGKPVVHGSIFQFEGQVSVFKPYAGPCYRCLFPTPPPPGRREPPPRRHAQRRWRKADRDRINSRQTCRNERAWCALPDALVAARKSFHGSISAYCESLRETPARYASRW